MPDGPPSWIRNAMMSPPNPGGAGAAPGPAGAGTAALQPLPTNLADFQRAYYANPDIIREIQGHPTGPTALTYQFYLANEEQKKAGMKQLQDMLGVLYRNRDASLKDLEGAGQTAIADATRESGRRKAGIGGDLVRRGLSSTTLADSLSLREDEALDRTKGAIREDVAARRASLRGGYAGQIAAAMGSVQHEAPQAQLIADLLRLKSTPKGTSGQYSPLFSALGGGLGAGIGAFTGNPLLGYTIGSGIGGGVGSLIR